MLFVVSLSLSQNTFNDVKYVKFEPVSFVSTKTLPL